MDEKKIKELVGQLKELFDAGEESEDILYALCDEVGIETGSKPEGK
jgi:hypothetical protein